MKMVGVDLILRKGFRRMTVGILAVLIAGVAFALPPTIQLEGSYEGHLQDIWWDGKDTMWWAQTKDILRTDMSGKVMARASVQGHYAGCEVRDGRLYVAVFQQNGKGVERRVRINVHDAQTLALLEEHVVDGPADGAGALAILPDGTFVVGCIRPPDINVRTQLRLHHIGRDYRLIASYLVDDVDVPLGIETIKRRDGELYLFTYSTTTPCIVLDAKTFRERRRVHGLNGACGLAFGTDFCYGGKTVRSKDGKWTSSVSSVPVTGASQRREAKIAVIGENLLVNRAGEDFPVERQIAYWTAAMDREAVHKPDMFVLPEICDIYLGLPRERKEQWLMARGGRILKAFRDYARGHGAYVVYPTYRKVGNAWANTAYLIGRDGTVLGTYDKYQPTVRDLENPYMKVVPGDKAFVAQTDFGTVGIIICFDLNFDGIFAQYEKMRPDVLVFPSYYDGDSWRYHRARQCGSWLVASTVGNLAKSVTDRAGHETAHVDGKTTRTFTATINTNSRVLHEDFNMQQVGAALKKYPALSLSEDHHDGLRLMTSSDPALDIDDVFTEFGIEGWFNYQARSRQVRESRLRASGPRPAR